MGNAKGHSQADKRVHRRDECVSATSTNAKVHITTNSKPLDSMVDKKSLRTERVWDWQKGETRNQSMDVLTNAQRQIGRQKICPVTNGRRRNQEDKKDANSQIGYAAVPTIGGRY